MKGGKQFDKLLEEHKNAKDCPSFLRHKSHQINMDAAQKEKLHLYELEQKPGDLVITNGYHQVYNLGLNLNVAANFVTDFEDVLRAAEARQCDNESCKYPDKSVQFQLKPKLDLSCPCGCEKKISCTRTVSLLCMIPTCTLFLVVSCFY